MRVNLAPVGFLWLALATCSAQAPMQLLGQQAPLLTDPSPRLDLGSGVQGTARITYVTDQNGTRPVNVSIMTIDGRQCVPLSDAGQLFGASVTRLDQPNRYSLARPDGSSVTLDLTQGIAILFMGLAVALSGNTGFADGQPALDLGTMGNLFGQSPSVNGGGMTLSPYTANTADPTGARAGYQQGWQDTLGQLGLADYARTLQDQAAQPAAPGLGGQTFTHIYATSEEPQQVASRGLQGDGRLHSEDLALALPSRSALMRKVSIRYPATGQVAVGTVVDVGPWNVDDPYWTKPSSRPQAEGGRDSRGRRTNRAGIDLSYGLWQALGVSRSTAYSGNHSDYVDWSFSDGAGATATE